MTWDAFLFGKPAVWLALGSLLAFAGGLILRRPWLAALGAVLTLPFCLLLSDDAVIVGVPVALCNVASVRMIQQRRIWPTAGLLLPLCTFLAIALWPK